ncbi:MAG: MMPL family transporter [Planctomycetota bacterium]|nr:MMPL family transporter [Planctomycetota bacterium]
MGMSGPVRRASCAVARAVTRRPRTVLAACTILTLASVLPAASVLLRLDVDLLNQIPGDLPKAAALREAVSVFGGADRLILAVELPEGAGAEAAGEAREFVKALAGEISRIEAFDPETGRSERAVESVEYRVDARLREFLIGLAKERIYVLLEGDEIGELARALEPPAMRAALEAGLARYRALPAMSPERRLIFEDPLGLAALGEKALARRLAGRTTAAMGGGSSSSSDGFIASPDGTMFLLIVYPARPAQDVNFSKAIVSAAREAAARVAGRFRAERPASRLSFPDFGAGEGKRDTVEVRVGLAGGYAVVAGTEAALRFDILSTAASSLIGVLLLFGLTFRRWSPIVFVAVPLTAAVLWTLAAARFVFGGIGVMGGAFACILIGLGIDYAVHVYNDFAARLRAGEDPAEAMERAIVEVAEPVVPAAVTTAAAFLGVAFSRFRGLVELGVLAGCGIVSCMVAMLVFLPAILLVFRRFSGAGDAKGPRGLGLGAIARLAGRRPGASLAAGGVVLAICAAWLASRAGPGTVFGARFDPDLTRLRSDRVLAFAVQDRIVKKFGFHFVDVKVLVSGKSEEETLERIREVARRAGPLLERGELTGVDSVVHYLPPLERQRACVERLKTLRLDGAAERFERIAGEVFGRRAADFAPFVERMKAMAAALESPRFVTLSELASGPAAGLVGRYFRVSEEAGGGKTFRAAAYLYPAELLPSEEWLGALDRTIGADGISVRTTSARMVGIEMRDAMLEDISRLMIILAALTAAVLLAAMRSLLRSVLALVPLVCALIGALAGSALMGDVLNVCLSLNVVNMVVFPILVGTGIDAGIYIVTAFFGRAGRNVEAVLVHTGRAVAICLLTTMVGFGSCALGSYTGLVAFGYVSLSGFAACLFGALVVLPAILSLCFAAGGCPAGTGVGASEQAAGRS